MAKSPLLKRGERVIVKIDRLSTGGRGVGRFNELVVFVSDTAPNEEVEIELTSVKKNFAEAKLIQVVSPSPFRIVPPCPVAGVCGGCSWQHVQYEEQLKQKREIVRSAFKKFSGFDVTDENSVEPTVASPKDFRYRNRIQLHRQNGRIGFTRRGSHDIVNIDDCPITEEAVAAEIRTLRADAPARGKDRVELYLTPQGQVLRRGATVERSEDGAEEVAGPAFAQVNRLQNEQLIEGVLTALGSRIDIAYAERIYDLYAGNGNFTFPVAQKFTKARILTAELSGANVELARTRARDEFADRDFTIERADVARFLEQQPPKTSDLVILDPPRTGCAPEVMRSLADASPHVIVYISCHPVTLARDLRFLKDVGYSLNLVRPYDMFPQTDHVETLAVLSKKP